MERLTGLCPLLSDQQICRRNLFGAASLSPDLHVVRHALKLSCQITDFRQAVRFLDLADYGPKIAHSVVAVNLFS
jgi:hypothetical protein